MVYPPKCSSDFGAIPYFEGRHGIFIFSSMLRVGRLTDLTRIQIPYNANIVNIFEIVPLLVKMNEKSRNVGIA
jgi:hypothetical protein